MTHQEGTNNGFLTSVAVTYLAPGTTEAPANRSDTGHSLEIGLESARAGLNYNPVLRNPLVAFSLVADTSVLGDKWMCTFHGWVSFTDRHSKIQ